MLWLLPQALHLFITDIMASKLGPKFSLLAKGRKDWTSTLTNPDTQVVVETNKGEAFVLEVFSEKFHTQLIESSEERWIFLAQIIREDEEILFAFENPRERTLFEELRSIDGIGPKSAALLVGRLGLAGFRGILEKNMYSTYFNDKNIKDLKEIIYKIGNKYYKIKTFGFVLIFGDTGTFIMKIKKDIILIGQAPDIKNDYLKYDRRMRATHNNMDFIKPSSKFLTPRQFKKTIGLTPKAYRKKYRTS
jgi:AraC-like DNA-binding protein